ncbi:putative transferase CAF17 homolog, mitochondrial [Branchiostoma floridae]|uniref:Transferase CAF17 homolog, mitochondrial n=1 Tax=Branchiostoma floridae TaxID=7739 RepID=A0A9J7KHG9_BRAFL|nr:putative transferase CAF17 homolog, mitochondrial [Branchiostoma floridae]
MAGRLGLCVRYSQMFLTKIHHLQTSSRNIRPSPTCQTKLLTRTFCSNTTAEDVKAKCVRLEERSLVRVAGSDTIPFLQGLVTNDVTSLNTENRALYTMILNVQGRVLYDILMYNLQSNPDSPPSLLLECDHTAVPSLIKLLKMYKIRKKVDICSVADEYTVWALLPGTSDPPVFVSDTGLSVIDPRLPDLGNRVVLKSGTNLVFDCVEGTSEDYHTHRYQLGVGEGVNDLPTGNCTPLECNLAFLNGVSFDKGCYVGQELTARTHHTGVIRKRLMPVTLDRPASLEAGSTLTNEKGKNVGKFRHAQGVHGIALVRLAHSQEKLYCKQDSGEEVGLKAETPKWWPQDPQQA